MEDEKEVVFIHKYTGSKISLECIKRLYNDGNNVIKFQSCNPKYNAQGFFCDDIDIFSYRVETIPLSDDWEVEVYNASSLSTKDVDEILAAANNKLSECVLDKLRNIVVKERQIIDRRV